MRFISLVIGRGGSSFRDKNITPVLGQPLIRWTAKAAAESRFLKEFYVSSDDSRILNCVQDLGFLPIVRPSWLATSEARGCDVLAHALTEMKPQISPEDIIVLQHANCATLLPSQIDDTIEILLDDDSLSAVVPAHIEQDNHPYRAKLLGNDGVVSGFFPQIPDISSNRQDLPTAVFFDHSFWTLRAKSIMELSGPPPWPCMGARVKAYLTSGGFDVHNPEDVIRTEQWLRANVV